MKNSSDPFVFVCVLVCLGCGRGTGTTPHETNQQQTAGETANHQHEIGKSPEGQERSVHEEPSNEPWQADCGALVKLVTGSLPKESSADGAFKIPADNEHLLKETERFNTSVERLKNKEIVWNLSFKELTTDKKGKELLRFDLEPFGIRQRFFSGKPVMIGFEPATGTGLIWRKLAPGAQVTISAVVASVTTSVMTPGNNPDKHVPVAAVWLGNVKALDGTAKGSRTKAAKQKAEPVR